MDRSSAEVAALAQDADDDLISGRGGRSTTPRECRRPFGRSGPQAAKVSWNRGEGGWHGGGAVTSPTPSAETLKDDTSPHRGRGAAPTGTGGPQGRFLTEVGRAGIFRRWRDVGFFKVR